MYLNENNLNTTYPTRKFKQKYYTTLKGLNVFSLDHRDVFNFSLFSDMCSYNVLWYKVAYLIYGLQIYVHIYSNDLYVAEITNISISY